MKNLILKLVLVVAIVLGFGSLALAEKPTVRQQSQKETVDNFITDPEWKVLYNVTPTVFQVSDLEYVIPHYAREVSIPGWTMWSRGGENEANMGFDDAKFIMAHQNEIPVKWQDKHLVFTGTIRQFSIGGPSVVCLRWLQDQWVLGWYSLALNFDHSYVLPRPHRKY